jgi:hypothetical protein
MPARFLSNQSYFVSTDGKKEQQEAKTTNQPLEWKEELCVIWYRFYRKRHNLSSQTIINNVFQTLTSLHLLELNTRNQL